MPQALHNINSVNQIILYSEVIYVRSFQMEKHYA